MYTLPFWPSPSCKFTSFVIDLVILKIQFFTFGWWALSQLIKCNRIVSLTSLPEILFVLFDFEGYIRFSSCHLFGPVNSINDTSIGDLPWIITISDTCKSQSKKLDSDNTINLSTLIVTLTRNGGEGMSVTFGGEPWKNLIERGQCYTRCTWSTLRHL